MQFHVGAFLYTLILADRRIYDEEGNELEGRALESPRVIVISSAVSPDRRIEVLRHEVQHCWHFHIPRPSTEEEEADLAAFIDHQFQEDLDAQGGRAAVSQLTPQRVPELGRPSVARQAPLAREPFGRPDRMTCSGCNGDVMCGSIVNGEPVLHEPTRRVWIERHMICDGCGTLTVWREVATPDGTPTGELIPVPPPRMLRGAEASRWLASVTAR